MFIGEGIGKFNVNMRAWVTVLSVSGISADGLLVSVVKKQSAL